MLPFKIQLTRRLWTPELPWRFICNLDHTTKVFMLIQLFKVLIWGKHRKSFRKRSPSKLRKEQRKFIERPFWTKLRRNSILKPMIKISKKFRKFVKTSFLHQHKFQNWRCSGSASMLFRCLQISNSMEIFLLSTQLSFCRICSEKIKK
jgi:hypothetical protein